MALVRLHYRALAFATLLAASNAGSAVEFRAGDIVVVSPWARATPERAKVGGGFMTLINKGSQDDRLMGAFSEISESVQIHEMHLVNGVMMMRHLNPGIGIKAGSSVTLKPFSHHLMFMDLKQPLVAGQNIKVTLQFEKAGKVDIDYEVVALGAKGPAPSQNNKR
jgi:periplasmic copper chaperone A